MNGGERLAFVVGRRRYRVANYQSIQPPFWTKYHGALVTGPIGGRVAHWECLHEHRTEKAAFDCARRALALVSAERI